MPGRIRRKERKFRLREDFSLDDKLRSRYRFGRESIELLVDFLHDDFERATAETMP